MKLESEGIILELRPFGERDLIARIFTRDHGLLAGMLRGGAAIKKNRPLVGMCGNASWNARLDSALGAFHFESSRNLAAPFMSDAPALSFMSSAFALVSTLLPEREQNAMLYDATIRMLDGLKMLYLRGVIARKNPAEQCYLDWEVWLLSALGYAVDFTRCSSCGRTDNLTHLSKRTARAVCAECAAPYLAQCFELPVDLNATKYFLERAASDMGAKLPLAREMLIDNA